MIELYTWKTPNGRKVPILLKDLGLAYELRPVYPWVDAAFSGPRDLGTYPNLRAWHERLGARPAVARGIAISGKPVL